MSSTAPAIILVDDDPDLVSVLSYHFEQWGYQVRTAASRQEFRAELVRTAFDLVLLDLQLGQDRGLDLLSELVQERFAAPIIILTAHASIETAVAAIKLGAYDYLTKPLDLVRLRQMLEHAIQKHAPPPPAAGNEPVDEYTSAGRPMLGESLTMRRLRQTIADAAPSNATVLILGESGTGKELVARSIHEQSARADGPFIAANMAALPAHLAESILFGHEKGAFSGADAMHRGWCEVADGGTLFLDEIGEMEIGLQAKLLRFLQERQIQRVGSSRLQSVDVRIVAATNRDPQELIRDRRLREDLYYRLNVLPIDLPPLRDRREDIPLLAEFFMRRTAEAHGKRISSISGEVFAALRQFDWPGNVRQLENLVQRLVITSPRSHIVPELLPPEFLCGVPAAATEPVDEWGVATDGSPELRPIARLEKEAILDALDRAEGNVVQAADFLGMGQATIYRKIKRYGIELKRHRRIPR
jgi:two-component system, NtrC family, response regulator HydG